MSGVVFLCRAVSDAIKFFTRVSATTLIAGYRFATERRSNSN